MKEKSSDGKRSKLFTPSPFWVSKPTNKISLERCYVPFTVRVVRVPFHPRSVRKGCEFSNFSILKGRKNRRVANSEQKIPDKYVVGWNLTSGASPRMKLCRVSTGNFFLAVRVHHIRLTGGAFPNSKNQSLCSNSKIPYSTTTTPTNFSVFKTQTLRSQAGN